MMDDTLSTELLDLLPSAVCVYSAGRIVYVNEAAVQLTGRSRNELTSEALDLMTIAAPLSSDALAEAVKRYETAPPESAPFHFTIISAGGRQIPIAGFSRQIQWNGQAGTLACSVEVTTLSEALHESETRYQKLVETCPDAIVLTNLEGRLLMANTELAHLHGYDNVDQLMRDRPFVQDLAVSQARQRANAVLEHVLQEGQVRGAEFPALRRDGSLVSVQVNASLLRNGASEPLGFIAAGRDISAQKKLIELKGALSSKVMAAQEQERWRVSRELHDGVGQLLTVIKMEAEWIANHPDDRGEVVSAAERVREKANQTLELVREMAHGLRPSVLDDLGVGCALETLAKDVTAHAKLQCEARCDMEDITPAIGTAIYRITQEALSNVLRHANAAHAWVRLTTSFVDSGDEVVLTVEDDGIGIDPDSSGDTLGIAGMQERATLLGGRVEISPREGGGTVVRVVIPMASD